jgi:hypothetical protein
MRGGYERVRKSYEDWHRSGWSVKHPPPFGTKVVVAVEEAVNVGMPTWGAKPLTTHGRCLLTPGAVRPAAIGGECAYVVRDAER